MKTQKFALIAALALLVSGCAAPIQAPTVLKPQPQTKAEEFIPVEKIPVRVAPEVVVPEIVPPLPAIPADALRDFGQIRGEQERMYSQPLPAPAIPADALRDFGQIRGEQERMYSQPLPVPTGIEADPYWSQFLPKQEQPAPVSEAVLRQQGQEQLYKEGYQPPNALLSIGQTDPSAYPAEVDAVVNAPFIGQTDPSAYPAEVEAVVNAPFIGQTDPSAYPAEVEAMQSLALVQKTRRR